MDFLILLCPLPQNHGLWDQTPFVLDAYGKMRGPALGSLTGFKWVLCVTPVLRCVCGLPSVWTQESTCHLIETHIRDQEELEGKKVAQYPCLWVNVSAVGRWAVLYHTEDTRDQNQQVLPGGNGCTSPNAWQVCWPVPNWLSFSSLER